MNRSHGSTFLPRHHAAFTLVELLVVVGIIVIGAAFLLPATSRIVESNNFTGAVNTISSALGNARSRAIRTGEATGVVFLFDVETESYTLQIIESRDSGFVTSRDRPDSVVPADYYGRRFVPAAGAPITELPKGIGVFGLSFSLSPGRVNISTNTPTLTDTLDEDTVAWYAGERITGSDPDFDRPDVNGVSGDLEEIPWIFPRNDPLLFLEDITFGTAQDPVEPTKALLWNESDNDINAIRAVRHAMSFMVVFDRRGRVVSNDPTQGTLTPNAYVELLDQPVDLVAPQEDREPLDDLNRFDPEAGLGEGIAANPEVFLRSVQQLAVVDLSDLAEGIQPALVEANDAVPGIRDAEVWQIRGNTEEIEGPELPQRDDGNPFSMFESDLAISAMSAWIDINAEVIGFNPYTGATIIRRDQ